MNLSKLFLYISCFSIITTSLFYYPKWNKSGTEATISWDVSGYYFYLPAFFIYKDVKELNFSKQILEKYRPTPELQQAFKSDNGNYVMKYSLGQSIAMLPAFIVGHITAGLTGYDQDGFSLPYQFSVFIWGMVISILGLYFLRKVLIQFFSELATGITILLIAIGTNYLEYSAITNSMTHNYLFTLYAILIWSTIEFYKKPSFFIAFITGSCLGLMTLIRPTEVIAILVPLLWGVGFSYVQFKERILLFFAEFEKVFIVAFCVIVLGSLQLFYWKFVSDSWLVYSYEDQGFSWLRPHLYEGFFSGRAGWFTYTPVMILIIPGFYCLSKQLKSITLPIILFTVIFTYISFAWDIWWYGGSIGQRTMVQIYPILAFPIAALIHSFNKINVIAIGISLFTILSVHYNIWIIHQAHYGGMFVAGEMTGEYLSFILLKNKIPDQATKLLDTKNIYTKPILNPLELISQNNSSILNTPFCLTDSLQYGPSHKILLPSNHGWLRLSGDFTTPNKEWESWKMTQMIIKYFKNGKEIGNDALRIQRHLQNGNTSNIYIDSKIIGGSDEVEVSFWNSGGTTTLCAENIDLIYHEGK